MAITGMQSFDDQVAAAQGSATGIDAERTDQNIRIPTAPNPSQLVSDHSAEGANYLPAARDIPQDPPAPGQWSADHDGPSIPFDYSAGDKFGTLAARPQTQHDGNEGGTNPAVWGKNHAQPNAYGLLNIGHPFLAIQNRIRHLRTSDMFDGQTGKNVNPGDAPSAPTQIWGSQHHTEPRWIGFDVSPLFENIGKGPQFSTNPGYLGVNDNPSNRAPRQYGSEVAQQPDDPYVYQGASAGPGQVDYSWDF